MAAARPMCGPLGYLGLRGLRLWLCQSWRIGGVKQQIRGRWSFEALSAQIPWRWPLTPPSGAAKPTFAGPSGGMVDAEVSKTSDASRASSSLASGTSFLRYLSCLVGLGRLRPMILD